MCFSPRKRNPGAWWYSPVHTPKEVHSLVEEDKKSGTWTIQNRLKNGANDPYMQLFCWESGENHIDHDDDAAKMRWGSHPGMAPSIPELEEALLPPPESLWEGVGYSSTPSVRWEQGVRASSAASHRGCPASLGIKRAHISGKHLKLKQFSMHLC